MSTHRIRALATLLICAAVSGCSHWTVKNAHSRCNPLSGGEGSGEDCLLPFPSSYYLRLDPSTPTGQRVDLTDAALPRSILGAPLDPNPYNERDGFSPVATLLAQFTTRIDPRGLPDPDHPEAAQRADSPVQLVAYDTGERVPMFAELDANANPRLEKQAIVLQPTVRLRPRTRYVAFIQDLRSPDGAPVPPLSGFRRLRDGAGIDPGSALAAERARFAEIFALGARAGLDRSRMQLAWDFTTGSDETVVGRMVRMRDAALARVEAETGHGPTLWLAAAGSGRRGARAIASLREPTESSESPESSAPPIHVDRVDEKPMGMPELWRDVHATFRAPSYLVGGDGNRLATFEHGEPRLVGDARFPLEIHVPECARKSDTPVPVMIYGHGTFNSAEHEMDLEYGRKLINRVCMIQVGTDWLGRAKSDLPYFLTKVIPDWNNFRQITDRLQQAHVNMAVLAHLIRQGELETLPELQSHGRSLVDSKRVYYYGISEGGCQGVTALALSPDLERGAMNVPCGFWSMFFWRSSDFYYTRRALAVMYPGAIELQKIMTLSQLLWDYTDPANYGGHLLRDPLPGNRPKRVLFQEGINDASVPNVTTRAMARTIGLSLLTPAVEPVTGLSEASGPLDSAYVQFDTGLRPRLGGNNIPPAKNPVHEDIRRLQAAQDQLGLFLRDDGKVVDTCGGKPCRF